MTRRIAQRELKHLAIDADGACEPQLELSSCRFISGQPQDRMNRATDDAFHRDRRRRTCPGIRDDARAVDEQDGSWKRGDGGRDYIERCHE
jgi:hypothetical protein